MELDKLAKTQGERTTTIIECAVGERGKQFTIADTEDVSAGIRLILSEQGTGDTWVLTQQSSETYHLKPERENRIELLSPEDITIA